MSMRMQALEAADIPGRGCMHKTYGTGKSQACSHLEVLILECVRDRSDGNKGECNQQKLPDHSDFRLSLQNDSVMSTSRPSI